MQRLTRFAFQPHMTPDVIQKMKKQIALLSFVLLISVNLYGNVGVFTGYGHSIELSSSDSIQMVSEEVTIIPGRGRFLFNGGVPGMDRVEYDCTFVLKNLEEKKVEIRAGFPLNSQFLNPPYGKEQKTGDLVARYSFIAQENGRQYSVDYAPGDKEKKLKNLFLWNMKFAPSETKIIRVTYSMPISMTLASSAKDWKSSEYEKHWYEGLEGCMLEWFGYVTETGLSWSGKIEKATFRVYVKGFEEYLLNRPLMEGMAAEDISETREKFPVWSPTIFRLIEPDDWKKDEKGFIELVYENYAPAQNLMFHYYILSMPQNRDDTISLIQHLGKVGFAQSDYQDLLDIFRAYNGENTDNQRIRKFLENQKWFGEEPIQKIPDAVFTVIREKMG